MHAAVFDALCVASQESPNGIPSPARLSEILSNPEYGLTPDEITTALGECTVGCGTVDEKHAPVAAKSVIEAWRYRQSLRTVTAIQAALESGDTRTFSVGIERLKGLQTFTGSTTAEPLMGLTMPAEESGAELIKHRFLCRGSGALLVGPSGIGKSSFSMQLGMCFAAGKPAFGFLPAMPLKVLLIQAENDDGDLVEMRTGVLSGMEFTESESERIRENFLTFRCDDKAGDDFFSSVVQPLLDKHRPDILLIDPLFAYLGGDSKNAVDVSSFCRRGLNPLLTRYSCGVIIVHHTNKPPASNQRPEWSGSDFAYLGAGSSELTNWARAVITIRQTGTDGVFELRGAKRGMRLRWVDESGTGTTVRFIRHSDQPGVICWEDADRPPDVDGKGAKKQVRIDPGAIAGIIERNGGCVRGGVNAADGLVAKVKAEFNCTKAVAFEAVQRAVGVSIEPHEEHNEEGGPRKIYRLKSSPSVRADEPEPGLHG